MANPRKNRPPSYYKRKERRANQRYMKIALSVNMHRLILSQIKRMDIRSYFYPFFIEGGI